MSARQVGAWALRHWRPLALLALVLACRLWGWSVLTVPVGLLWAAFERWPWPTAIASVLTVWVLSTAPDTGPALRGIFRDRARRRAAEEERSLQAERERQEAEELERQRVERAARQAAAEAEAERDRTEREAAAARRAVTALERKAAALTDLLAAFEGEPAAFSATIIERLGRPELSTAWAMNDHLRPLGLETVRVRVGGHQRRGLRRADVEQALAEISRRVSEAQAAAPARGR